MRRKSKIQLLIKTPQGKKIVFKVVSEFLISIKKFLLVSIPLSKHTRKRTNAFAANSSNHKSNNGNV